MARSVKEWIGRTDDTKAPPRVRARIFEREGGLCHISGRKIMPGDLWDLDHVPALINGGQNRESMMFPALRDKHREKTAEDVAEKAKIAAIAGKHIGAIRPKGKLQSPGFPRSAKSREPSTKTHLPPRQMYEDSI